MNVREAFITQVRDALQLEHPYRFRPLTGGRPSAVLMLWGFSSSSDLDLDSEPEPRLLITKRAETLESHKGQYAFPGGAFDAEDERQQGLLTTALRETWEEVGIPSDEIEILGELPTLATPSGFRIHPFVGYLKRSIEEVPFQLSVEEIDFMLWISIERLKSVHRLERIRIGSGEFETDVFLVDDHRIWGATGGVIQNFLERLRRVL